MACGPVLSLSASVEDRLSDDSDSFSGDSELWIIDAIWKWAPSGNSTVHSATVQAEYLQRNEKGVVSTGLDSLATDRDQSGWYLQGVYQFMPQWQAGLRYEQMALGDTPTMLRGSSLDTTGYRPKSTSVMIDWNNSEFSRLRLQLTEDQASPDNNTLIILQYTAAFGAHGAHSF